MRNTIINANGGTVYVETPSSRTTYSGNNALGTTCDLP
jgi:hypothetical protein